MVRTRTNRQSAGDAEVQAPDASAANGSGDIADGSDNRENPQDKQIVALDPELESIGQRLRKRRRTGSSNSESSLSNKRPNLRRTASPEPKRTDVVERKKSEGPEDESDRSEQRINVNGNKALPQIEQIISLDNVDGMQVTEDNATADTDLSAVIAEIVDHGINVERRLAVEDGDEATVDTESWKAVDASIHLKVQSLPILDNLSTQILNSLAKSTYQDITIMVTQPQSESGQCYATLKSLFDHTKKVYSIHDAFLSAPALGFTEPRHIEIIRKANLATFVSSVFGSQEVGFFYLNQHFLDTFVPGGQRLLKSQGGLYLELKTQTYISAMSSGDRTRGREDLLNELFPPDMEQLLLIRRPGARTLAPSETDFVNRCRSRREHLIAEHETEEAIMGLSSKYIWEDFLRDICQYVSKNFDTIGIQSHARKPIRTKGPMYSGNEFIQVQNPNQDEDEQKQMSSDKQEAVNIDDLQLVANNFIPGQQHATVANTLRQNPNGPEVQTAMDDIAKAAAHAAEVALQGININGRPASDYPQAQGNQPFQSINIPAPQPQQDTPYADPNAIPYHTQSAPTQVLYERARQAATAKASPTNRRAGVPSQRRPWTTEEENALMAGLDRVKGPHWSQILAMFGPGGTINETLKDRNQVQLKDKARNLKLFFLKSGIEVPYYLQFVTGELKTRAPAQAAKNEARERAKAKGAEDKAHVEGVLTLANSQTVGEDGNGPGFANHQNGPSPTYTQNVAQSLQAATAAANAGASFTGRSTSHLPASYNFPNFANARDAGAAAGAAAAASFGQPMNGLAGFGMSSSPTVTLGPPMSPIHGLATAVNGLSPMSAPPEAPMASITSTAAPVPTSVPTTEETLMQALAADNAQSVSRAVAPMQEVIDSQSSIS